MKILVSGAAGFIGYSLVQKLCSLGFSVTGLDNINDYYDVKLKLLRLKNTGITTDNIKYGEKIKSSSLNNYTFIKLDLTDEKNISSLFEKENFDCVCHLAAQAGVRYSLDNPRAYIDSNISGFLNILEACRFFDTKHLVYASSSSVYGLNEKVPFSIDDPVNSPVSLYAASKRSNELMAFTYSHLFNIPITGLRFFTVYGPWGRPDMAPELFTSAIIKGQPLKVFNNGNMERDFTYIDDIVNGVLLALDNIAAPSPDWNPANPDPAVSSAPYRIYNLGNSSPVKLMDFISLIEKYTEKKAKYEFLPMQPGDVVRTCSDITDTTQNIGYNPSVSIEKGVAQFVDWFASYYS